MVGEQHLEEAALALKKYMDVNTCGFCKRKAEGINRAIIGLREVTGEAQELAKKIQERKELAGIDKGGLEMPSSRPVPSYVPPVPRPVPETAYPVISDSMRKRIAAKWSQHSAPPPPQRVVIEEPEEKPGGILGNRPKLRDIFYLGD